MVRYAYLCKEGNRNKNEDSILTIDEENNSLFVIADGLGGQGDGDIASKAVVDKFRENYDNIDKKNTREFINITIEECNKLINSKKEDSVKTDMMSTVVALLIDKNNIFFGHVGDSRIYRFEKDKLIERTQDHSVPQVLVKTGELKESEIRHHPDRNRLLRALGMGEKKGHINSFQTIGRNGVPMAFLLCSDGFWEFIEEKEMERILNNSNTPEQWLEVMEKEVISNGKNYNMDNYSAICVFVDK